MNYGIRALRLLLGIIYLPPEISHGWMPVYLSASEMPSELRAKDASWRGANLRRGRAAPGRICPLDIVKALLRTAPWLATAA